MRKIKKVLLIFPPTKVPKHSHKPCVPPLGILHIAAVLREANYEVKVIDATVEGYYNEEQEGDNFVRYGLSFDELERRIREINPDIVGISCLFSLSFTAVKKLCKIVKKFDKNITTATGGTHPSFLAERCLKECPELDYIVIGEGEYTSRELIYNLNSGKELDDIDGLAYRKNGEIKINLKTKFIDNLDELPLPARDLVPITRYISINSPHGITSKRKINMSVMTSRGCPFLCTFCSSSVFWGRKYRMRSVESVLDELEMLVKKYGAKEVQFLDDNFTLNRERAKKLFQGMIDRKLDVVWNTPNGIAIWTLDEELLALMKKSGCYALTLAVESGDQDVLDHIIKKPLKLEQVRKAVKMIKKLGIQTHAFFMVGFPDEKPEQIERTFKFAKVLDLDSASFQIPQPLPGSDLDRQLKERRCIKDSFDYENIAYLLSSYDTTYFKGKELEKKVAKEFLKFNLSLAYRHPLRFMSKFGFYVMKNPVSSVKFLMGFVKKASTNNKEQTNAVEYWNDLWINYHAVNEKRVRHYFKVFNFYNDVQKDKKIIDIGCGSGQALNVLRKNGYQNLCGLEPEKRLFEKNDYGIIKQGDCLNRPSVKNYYDIVLMLGVLHHLQNFNDIKTCLLNVKEVLKVGGRFYSVEQWKNIVRTIAMKLVRDTPLGLINKTLRIERELLNLERKQLTQWLEIEKQVTDYAQKIGLKVILHKRDIRYRYIIFERVL